MPTAVEITDSLLRTYTRVLPVGDGVCDVCHGAPGAGWSRCWSCNDSIRQVSMPVELVVPISLTDLQGQLHHVLKNYKQTSYPSSVTDKFQVQISALLARFLAHHGHCIATAGGGGWDTITIVPSSTDRVGPHPLERVTSMFESLKDQYEPLLRRGPGTATHNTATDDAYAVTTDVRGRRILLVDDTFTSGARVQSAASTLQVAGARVVAAVPIGRVIRPEYNAESAALMKEARRQPFDFSRCCLE